MMNVSSSKQHSTCHPDQTIAENILTRIFSHQTNKQNAFTRASQLLYNSTDGQLQIGVVNFYNNCPEAERKADFLIWEGAGVAAAHVGGLGKPNRNVYVYDGTHTRNDAAARGHFGIVHELGHYVFKLYDEYKDTES